MSIDEGDRRYLEAVRAVGGGSRHKIADQLDEDEDQDEAIKTALERFTDAGYLLRLDAIAYFPAAERTDEPSEPLPGYSLTDAGRAALGE